MNNTGKIVLIVPTKDRPFELRQMLASIAGQSRPPDEVIIVDASSSPAAQAADFPGLRIKYHHYEGAASTAAQRNAGIGLLPEDTGWVVFFDDDQILFPDALEKMSDFLGGIPENGGGGIFYCTDYDRARPMPWLRKAASLLGLYPAMPGGVAPSGWQRTLCGAANGIKTQWAPSGALAIRPELLKKYPFDSYFQGYSYLEDLDFSYTIGETHPFFLVKDAVFEHHHSSSNRISRYDFGIMELENRRYFVKKHKLSLWRYRVTMFFRFCASVASGQFFRAAGNIKAALTRKKAKS